LGPIFDFGRIFEGLDINFEFFTPKMAHPCVRPRRLSHCAWKSADRSDLEVCQQKKGIYTIEKFSLYFTYLPRSPQ